MRPGYGAVALGLEAYAHACRERVGDAEAYVVARGLILGPDVAEAYDQIFHISMLLVLGMPAPR